VTSLVVEQGVLGTWASVVGAPGLWSTGSIVVAHGLSCSEACGIFLDQESTPCLLHWQDSLPGKLREDLCIARRVPSFPESSGFALKAFN